MDDSLCKCISSQNFTELRLILVLGVLPLVYRVLYTYKIQLANMIMNALDYFKTTI